MKELKESRKMREREGGMNGSQMHTEVEGDYVMSVSQRVSPPHCQPVEAFPCYNGLIMFRTKLTGVLGFWNTSVGGASKRY